MRSVTACSSSFPSGSFRMTRASRGAEVVSRWALLRCRVQIESRLVFLLSAFSTCLRRGRRIFWAGSTCSIYPTIYPLPRLFFYNPETPEVAGENGKMQMADRFLGPEVYSGPGTDPWMGWGSADVREGRHGLLGLSRRCSDRVGSWHGLESGVETVLEAPAGRIESVHRACYEYGEGLGLLWISRYSLLYSFPFLFSFPSLPSFSL